MVRHGEEPLAGPDAVRAPFGVVEDAVDSIGTTLNERTTCGEVARFLCRHGCDAAAVDLLAEDVPAVADAAAGALTRVVTDGRADLLDSGLSRSGGALEVRALDEGHPITAGSQLVGGVPRSVMTVPLLAHGRLYGALLAVRNGSDFDAQDTATLHYVARLAAVHLGHDREHTAVHSTALNLQRALLAEPGRPHPNLDIATRYLPVGGGALVGGDWYETVRLHYGRTLLVMGDVMGHGLDAAVDMNAYRSTLRYVASTDLPPHRVLRQLDAAVAEDSTRRPATCLLIRVDPARGTAAIATAGHLPPVLFAPDGTGTLLDLPVGPPLGTGVGGYVLTKQQLEPGSTLVLFTDGLVERRDEDIDVSLSRLAALRVPPRVAAPGGPRPHPRPRGGRFRGRRRRGGPGGPHPSPLTLTVSRPRERGCHLRWPSLYRSVSAGRAVPRAPWGLPSAVEGGRFSGARGGTPTRSAGGERSAQP